MAQDYIAAQGDTARADKLLASLMRNAEGDNAYGSFIVRHGVEGEIKAEARYPDGVLVFGNVNANGPGALFTEMKLTLMVCRGRYTTDYRYETEASFGRVVMPKSLFEAVYAQFSDVTRARENTLRIGLPTVNPGKKLWLEVRNVIFSSLQTVQAAEMTITEVLSLVAGKTSVCESQEFMGSDWAVTSK